MEGLWSARINEPNIHLLLLCMADKKDACVYLKVLQKQYLHRRYRECNDKTVFCNVGKSGIQSPLMEYHKLVLFA